MRKVPFVAICAAALAGACPRTRRKDCNCYHVYIRPSTEHIIDMLYPVQVSRARRSLQPLAERQE